MAKERHSSQPGTLGKVVLLSSGETSAIGHQLLEHVFAELPRPIRVAILETAAGFELNSPQVAKRVGDFILHSLKNYSPEVAVVPARRRDGPLSTNDPDILKPLLGANFLYLGAGSPTYLVRHLQGTLALQYLVRRHRAGGALCLASAAAIAFGAKTLPVYEIFKAGHDLHWVDGLDLLGPFGLDLAIVSHWDNREGGEGLDTSHCYMGRSRMEQLRRMLPAQTVVLGIDEHTAVILDLETAQGHVMGKGGVALLAPGSMRTLNSGASFPLDLLGPYRKPSLMPGYAPEAAPAGAPADQQRQAPAEVLALMEKREEARRTHSWAEADAIRKRLFDLGYSVQDTPEGPRWHYVGK